MPDLNPSFSSVSRSDLFQAQIDKLEALGHRPLNADVLNDFDAETEQLLTDTFGGSNRMVETYKYAAMGEAETMVNLPESAQEEVSQDVPKKALQQRRQVLEGCLSELHDAETREEKALAGEDREDPPMMS